MEVERVNQWAAEAGEDLELYDYDRLNRLTTTVRDGATAETIPLAARMLVGIHLQQLLLLGSFAIATFTYIIYMEFENSNSPHKKLMTNRFPAAFFLGAICLFLVACGAGSSSGSQSVAPENMGKKISDVSGKLSTLSEPQLFEIGEAQSNDDLWPARNLVSGGVYSSDAFSSPNNDRGTWLAAWLANGHQEISEILLTARTPNGRVLGFPKRYEILVTSSDGQQWIPIGIYSTQPDNSGTATIELGTTFRTNGVMIKPLALGDDGGGHYFQIAKIQMANGRQTRYAMGAVDVSEVIDNTNWSKNNAIDGNLSTAYSSKFFPTSQNDRGVSLAAWLTGGPQPTSQVILTARMENGQPLGFPKAYDIFLTSPDNSKWIFAGHFSNQPNSAGVATVDLSSLYSTHGVWIQPNTLGVDDQGSHYFQLAEVQLAREVTSGISATLNSPILLRGNTSFVPNQLAGNVWFKPLNSQGLPSLINGHIDGSFSAFYRWSTLMNHLQANQGGFGTHSSEIGHLSSGTLFSFRNQGLPMSVELPGMTQCLPGIVLANLEVNGISPAGQNYFNSIFQIDGSQTDRTNPQGNGWFVDRNGNSYTPDEVIFDERMPNLLPNYMGNQSQLFNGALPFSERLANSATSPCPSAASFHPNLDLIGGLIQDYVDYIEVMKTRFRSMPKVAIHWNVNPNWEFSDRACLETLNQKYPAVGDFRNALVNLTSPCHRDTQHLVRLVETLCSAGTCPSTVFMDVDYLYNTGYALSVLRKNKAALQTLGVGFGINVVDQAGSILANAGGIQGRNAGWAVNRSGDGTQLITVNRQGDGTPASENALHQESMLNVVSFFADQGIIDGQTKVRIASWSPRAYEIGAEISETSGAKTANTANRIFAEYLIPRGFAK